MPDDLKSQIQQVVSTVAANEQMQPQPLKYAQPPAEPEPTKDKTKYRYYLDLFLEEQEQRYERGQKLPNAPRKEKISAARLVSIRVTLKPFRQFADAKPFKDDEGEIVQCRQGNVHVSRAERITLLYRRPGPGRKICLLGGG